MSTDNKRVKPLLKYAGNKYEEYKFIQDYLPEKIDDYYEPFVGAGGIYIQLRNDDLISGKSYINDISDELMLFYSMIGKDEFILELEKIADAWEVLKDISENNSSQFKEDSKMCVTGKDEDGGEVKLDLLFNETLKGYLADTIRDNKEFDFIGKHNVDLSEHIFASFKDKIGRMHNKYIKNEEKVNLETLPEAIKTAYAQGFYFTIRDMYNSWRTWKETGYTDYEKAAQWYYLREYCFGSMFRYNKKGEFNIPYGGRSYDKKCFQCKIDALKDPKTIEFFTNKLELDCQDYESSLNRKFGKDDFIFFDPPYDTTFSEYNNCPFDIEEQWRLRSFLKKLPCKWMMVVQSTDFMRKIYKDFLDGSVEYDKSYAYQARGSYNKKVKHLILKNY